MPETDIHRWKEKRLSHWLTQAAASGMTGALRSLDPAGAAAELKFEPQHPNPELWKQWKEPKWFELAADLAAGANVSVGCATDTFRLLAAVMAGEPELPEPMAEKSYREVLNQVAGFVGSAASEKCARAIQFAQAVPSAGPLIPELGFEFRFQLSNTNHLLAFVPSEPFLETILSPVASSGRSTTSDPGARPDLLSPPGDSPEGGAKTALTGAAKNNLELLLEVELEIGVSFGRTRLPLEEVLKLASGSIVELNRSVTDPVDVLINDTVIARGEVVVVDGNYGIRVTEVVSRRERIRSIF